MADELQIKVRAIVDTSQLQKELDKATYKIKASLSPESLDNIKNQLSQIAKLQTNINIGVNNQQVSQQVSAVSENIKSEMQKINQVAAVQPQVRIDLSQLRNQEELVKADTDVLIKQIVTKLQ